DRVPNQLSRGSIAWRAVAGRNPRHPAPILDRRLRDRGLLAAPTRPSPGAPRTATLTPNRRHVLAVATHRLATLASGHSRFVGRPLMGRPLRVGRTPTLTRDLTLTITIHRGESPIARAAAFRGPIRTSVLVLHFAIALLRHLRPPPAFTSALV